MRYGLTAALLIGAVSAAPQFEKRVTCAPIHVFGARETTAPAGYGSSDTVVDDILAAYPGSTSEALSYPACGGQTSCGSVSYANSVLQGISAATTAINSYAASCPDAQLVLVGYSQGGQVFDDVYCGGPDTPEGWATTGSPLSAAALKQIKAAIFQGDPRRVNGLSYNVGTCTAQGFAARPAGFTCAYAANIQSYCDSADPYCCTGSDATVHQGYGAEYGAQALAFVKTKLSATSGTTGGSAPSAPAAPAPTQPAAGGGSTGSGSCAAKYGQCGGTGWQGATCCASGSTCQAANSYYSQCL